jgi:cytochrome c oxidase subunit 4
MNPREPSPRTYVAIFATLILLTGVTVTVAFVDLKALNTVAATGIAAVKAALVALYFMHLRHSSRMVWLSAFAAVVFLVILFALTLSDVMTRGWIPQPGAW